MITELEELVFGLNSYEKTKIEDRFLMIEEKIPSILISNIDEYTILENCIFKIKEQLRVKSSNLNTNIKKTNKLTKKKVLEILKKLEDIRISIISKAFEIKIENNSHNQINHNNIETEEINEVSNNINIERKNEVVSEINNSTKNITLKESNEEKNINKPKKISLNQDEKSFIDIKNKIENQKLNQLTHPLITISKNEKSISLFNEHCANQSPLVQKRQNSELKDIDSTLSIITNYKYVNINTPKTTIETKKDEEDSLENLLNSKESTHKHLPSYNNTNQENTKISMIKNDNPIIVEKKEIIEKKKEEEKIETYLKEDEEKTTEINNSNNTLSIPDETLNIEIDSFAKNKGQYKISFKKDSSIEKIDDSDLMYSTLFSKALLQSVFQSIQPQGSMLATSLKSKEIFLTPRYLEDNIFQFERKQANESELQFIQDKILNTMKSELETENVSTINEKNNPEQKEIEIKEENISNESTTATKNSSQEEKAKYLLSSLRRLA